MQLTINIKRKRGEEHRTENAFNDLMVDSVKILIF